jgi:hypothetical protein
MTTTTKFNLVSHYTGEASTSGSSTFSISTDFTGSSTSSPVTSYVKWRPAKQTAAPDKRYFRSFKTQSFVYLITLKPTTSDWQTKLSEIEIGYTRFVRPDHVHCIPNFTPLSVGSISSGEGDFNVTIRDANGNPLPNAIVVYRRRDYTYSFSFGAGPGIRAFWSGFGDGRFVPALTSDVTKFLTADSSGVVTNALHNSLGGTVVSGFGGPFSGPIHVVNTPFFYDLTVYDPNRAWKSPFEYFGHSVRTNPAASFYALTAPQVYWTGSVVPNPVPFSQPQSISVDTYLPYSQSSNAMKQKIWPQDTFTAWGAAYVLADRDWMPRVILTHVSPANPVDFDASMTIWRVSNLRLGLSGSFPNAIPSSDATQTSNLASPTAPFAFSRHESLPPGLYWRSTGYPGSYMSPTARWSAVPGSDVTGYTPPAEEPSCPFVVKTGTI